MRTHGAADGRPLLHPTELRARVEDSPLVSFDVEIRAIRHGSVKRVASAVGEGSVVVPAVHQHFVRSSLLHPAQVA